MSQIPRAEPRMPLLGVMPRSSAYKSVPLGTGLSFCTRQQRIYFHTAAVDGEYGAQSSLLTTLSLTNFGLCPDLLVLVDVFVITTDMWEVGDTTPRNSGCGYSTCTYMYGSSTCSKLHVGRLLVQLYLHVDYHYSCTLTM